MTELGRQVARIAGAVARILGECPHVADVDRRRVLLDAAGELLETGIAMMHDEPDTGAALSPRRMVLELLRRVAGEHAALTRENEAALRERGRGRRA